MRGNSKGKQWRRKSDAARGWRRHMNDVKKERRKFVPVFHAPKRSASYRLHRSRPFVKEAPEVFSFERDVDGVVGFLNKMRSIQTQSYDRIIIDLRNVKVIDTAAVVMLLSNMYHLAKSGVFVSGQYPRDPEANQIMRNSGFDAHVTNINKTEADTAQGQNLIVNVGWKSYSSIDADKVIQKVIEYVNGNTKLYQHLNGIVGEMGGNTIQYAYSDTRHYLFGATFLDDSVQFVFADTGFGILSTLKKSLGRWMSDLMNARGPVSVLNGAYDKKYGSQTRDENRNTGLPFIKRTFEEKYISDLCVISNDALINFEDQSKSKKLKTNYKGTVYIWTVKRTQ